MAKRKTNKTDKPHDVLAVYDSKEHVADRYTVLLDPKAGWEKQRGLYQCIGLSAQPSHPQGVSQFTSCQITHRRLRDNDHLGKMIRWGSLPAHVRAHVKARLK